MIELILRALSAGDGDDASMSNTHPTTTTYPRPRNVDHRAPLRVRPLRVGDARPDDVRSQLLAHRATGRNAFDAGAAVDRDAAGKPLADSCFADTQSDSEIGVLDVHAVMLSRTKPGGQVALVAPVKHYLKNAAMSSTLAQRIKTLRKKLGLTQEAFGAELGVSKAAVSQWESDKEDQRTKPTVENLQAIAELAHTTLSWLLEENGPKDTAPSPKEVDELTPFTLAEALAAALAASNAARRQISADVIRRLAEDPGNADLIRALADMLTADDVAAEHEFERGNPERPRRLPRPSAGGNVSQAPANDPKKRGAA